MMNLHNKYFKTILFLILLINLINNKNCICQTSEFEEIEQLIQKFCTYDSAGYRLSSETIQPVINLIKNFEESCWDSGWDVFTIIQDFNIDSIKAISAKQYEVFLIFTNICKNFSWDEKLNTNTNYKTFKMIVEKENKTWKIVEPCFHPHISLETALNKFIEYREGMVPFSQGGYSTNEEIKIVDQNIKKLQKYKIGAKK